jgi:hypothetical protein
MPLAPSCAQRVTRRLPPSQMTRRPWRSNVVPLLSFVFDRSSSGALPGVMRWRLFFRMSTK